MKKALLLLASLLLVAGMVLAGTACVPDDEATMTAGLSTWDHMGTLQGKIMNGITGEAIGGDDLEVYLIQGDDQRKPSELHKGEDDTFKGEYVFNDVPVGLCDASGELEFKLVVINPSYQTYTGYIELCAELVEGYSWENDQVNNTFANGVFNFIEDIYLYPIGTAPGDVNVYVYGPDGKPISNASVYLRQSDYLKPQLMPASSTDNKYVFSSADLALSRSYSIMVEPLTVDGQELRMYSSSSFTVGVDTLNRVVNMNVASGSDDLFATSASNQVQGTVTTDGKLTITFNQPVILDTTEFNAWESGNGVLDIDTPVTAVLSNDGITLTLTPNFSDMPNDKGATVTYSYTGGDIWLKNSQMNSHQALFSEVPILGTNGYVSGTVLMTAY